MAKIAIRCGWRDVPHLTDEDCAEMLKSIPPYQRKARSEGIPILGAGAIYPFDEESYIVDPFDVPKHWPRGYGLDVGWNRTAALWGALDRETETLYLYSEHYLAEAEPIIHAHAIQKRGDWVSGKIDPASRGRGQADGKQLLKIYRDDLHLLITEANNAVWAGIDQVYMLFSTGRLKVFKQLVNFRSEQSVYRRDEHGKVVKEDDHLMDCLRYLCVDGFEWMQTEPVSRYEQKRNYGWQV